MERVGDLGINCPICLKNDWCLVSRDGSKAICARISEGSVKQCGNAGWLHILKENQNRRFVPRKEKRIVPINWSKLQDLYTAGLHKSKPLFGDSHLDIISNELGITEFSLRRMGIGYDGDAYTFPLWNFKHEIVGIQRRFIDGGKAMVKGSRTGIFVPDGIPWEQRYIGSLFICEGVTDTATALDLGYHALGKMNCNSGTLILGKALKARDIAIMADNDKVGLTGACSLRKRLNKRNWRVIVITPPEGIKDLRMWKKKEPNLKNVLDIETKRLYSEL